MLFASHLLVRKDLYQLGSGWLRLSRNAAASRRGNTSARVDVSTAAVHVAIGLATASVTARVALLDTAATTATMMMTATATAMVTSLGVQRGHEGD
jgi:hypothetical protein